MIAAGKACGEALRAAGVVGKSSMERDQMISNATTFDSSPDSHYLWHSDNRLHL